MPKSPAAAGQQAKLITALSLAVRTFRARPIGMEMKAGSFTWCMRGLLREVSVGCREGNIQRD